MATYTMEWRRQPAGCHGLDVCYHYVKVVVPNVVEARSEYRDIRDAAQIHADVQASFRRKGA